ncbi:MAG TPA: tRNA (N(6)-L-threonylcarbamoyladenosine(37)-C(2))-methylthiotransferase MtaB, partial [Aequorivita sp.]|nr:tRNA (N(6)-L-threonylcarbamoyladenosine(37)-C(2))-methylthiotransferase MtaB [Aequorivita sp.]
MNASKKVAFYTLGCKLNFSETSTIARSFEGEGFDRVDFSEKADIYVINTRSVTEN